MKIGIIGTGAMGKRHALEFAKSGFDVLCHDSREDKRQLGSELKALHEKIRLAESGRQVSAESDIIFYLVPVQNIWEAAHDFGKHTRAQATVCSGLSVMTPGVEAFNLHIPDNVNIMSLHLLCSPSVRDLGGQRSILLDTKSTEKSRNDAISAFTALKVKIFEVQSPEQHDQVTANTQATVQTSFLAMALACTTAGFFPWENRHYIGGLDNIKVLMMQRILGGKAHVYGSLAMDNQFARKQILEYCMQTMSIMNMVRKGDIRRIRETLSKAGDAAFIPRKMRILDNSVMQEFSLSCIPKEERLGNSNISLFSHPLAWLNTGVNPFFSPELAPPPARFMCDMVQALFQDKELFEESINAMADRKLIAHDEIFLDSLKTLTGIIARHDLTAYTNVFDSTKTFFNGRLAEAVRRSDELVERFSTLERDLTTSIDSNTCSTVF
ncbi:MAG: prephenate dehydrogenase [Candidatus Micrarchaeota archaeon]|nr:prephenate dehydrogenase [Candidatus Micrarchaeota archaeon]MDE1847717.1 prephenate dehydrogenase [Candidatus Micrarchaeota archaeon]MDE1864146.1 prephenate dehydrogenase [Candidatus Micrarchaeota archaeon]